MERTGLHGGMLLPNSSAPAESRVRSRPGEEAGPLSTRDENAGPAYSPSSNREGSRRFMTPPTPSPEDSLIQQATRRLIFAWETPRVLDAGSVAESIRMRNPCDTFGGLAGRSRAG